MSEPSTTSSLPLSNDYDSMVRHYFPDLAVLVSDFLYQTLHAFVHQSEESGEAIPIPRQANPTFSASGGGALDTTRARYTWTIANDVITLKVKPLGAVPEGHERSALLQEDRRGLTRLVLCDTLIKKQFVESRKSHGRIESSLSHLHSDGTRPPIECTGDPFLLHSLSPVDDSASHTGRPPLAVYLELPTTHLLLPVRQTPWLAQMDDPSRPRDCTDVLQQYFQPLQPYLSELKCKTIGQYLEYMRADPSNSFKTDGPDNWGVKETTVNIRNKATVIANQGSEVNTLEIFLVAGVGKVLLDEGQKSIRITNAQGSQIMERELQSGRLRREFTNPATLERFDLTGDTIYFQVTAHTPPADAHVSSTPSRGDRASVNTTHEDPLIRAESSRSTAPGSSQRGHGRRNTSGAPPCRTQ